MLTFCVISFVVGLGLAALFSVQQFALGLLLIAFGGIIQALSFGASFGESLFATAILFGCGQFGYVAGFGLRALIERRAARRRPPASADLKTPAEIDQSLPGSPANRSH